MNSLLFSIILANSALLAKENIREINTQEEIVQEIVQEDILTEVIVQETVLTSQCESGALVFLSGEQKLRISEKEISWTPAPKGNEVRAIASWSTDALADALKKSSPRAHDADFKICGRTWGEWMKTLGLSLFRESDPKLCAISAKFLLGRKGCAASSAFWLLAHDKNPGVREAALDEALEQTALFACSTDWFSTFMDDENPEIAAAARDQIALTDISLALAGANTEYKLSLIARLTHDIIQKDDESARAALKILRNDSDQQVRQAADMALAGSEH
ncbi:hypothetical protein KAI87_08790 [Myxococcota bacterium]|nr:hypothetical protein [Myxococcota bacterium]